ncbi:hypothetical protein NPIL_564371 [Nephila pilipes]|uniref:Uncharacterized protein n=1 Tax=Nephila pilipes TaxID=299642 RepID=A0A8X6U3X2_NEPPI|nr:hypothetical protein NPIL_564371 [Nephila pilipes]
MGVCYGVHEKRRQHKCSANAHRTSPLSSPSDAKEKEKKVARTQICEWGGVLFHLNCPSHPLIWKPRALRMDEMEYFSMVGYHRVFSGIRALRRIFVEEAAQEIRRSMERTRSTNGDVTNRYAGRLPFSSADPQLFDGGVTTIPEGR